MDKLLLKGPNKFQKKFGLLDFVELELPIKKSDFVRILQSNVDDDRPDFMDVFSSSKRKYKGEVGDDAFKIRSKRRFFDTFETSFRPSKNLITIKGNLNNNQENTVIKIEIDGFHSFMLVYYFVLLMFYPIFFLALSKGKSNENFWLILFAVAHATLMVFIPIFMMRSGVKLWRQDVEREFKEMIRKG